VPRRKKMKYGPYSHSRIQTGYCPLAFKKRYIDQDQGVQRGNAGFGKVVHLIIADIIKAQVDNVAYDVTELIKFHMPHDLLPRLGEMQDIFETFTKRFHFNKSNVVGVEEAVAVDFDGREAPWAQSYLRGVLDVIEIDGEHATVTDHKTQFQAADAVLLPGQVHVSAAKEVHHQDLLRQVRSIQV
jgi:tellurite resistance-related uncharacterized protein